MKNIGKLKAKSLTNSGRGIKHPSSGRGTPHVNSGRGTPHRNKLPEISQANSGRQTVHTNAYKQNLDKYNWICKRVLQAGLGCAISFALGKKQRAEQVHHVYPRLRAPQYVWNENFLLPLTWAHHVKVEGEEEKLAWEQQEVIIGEICYKLDLEAFRKAWKAFRLEYEKKYENGVEIEEDQAF